MLVNGTRSARAIRPCSSSPIATNIHVRKTRVISATKDASYDVKPSTELCRRSILGLMAVAAMMSPAGSATAADIDIPSNEDGFGTRPAQKGDLILVHYVGYVGGTDQVFDSTKGGLKYRDGGLGILRPVMLRVGGDPVPGICEGLQRGFQGMRVGGKRTITVPPELGFGSQPALAPYALLPGGSTVRYEIELLRLSTKGPDELTKGLDRCGAGGASETAENCTKISMLEVL